MRRKGGCRLPKSAARNSHILAARVWGEPFFWSRSTRLPRPACRQSVLPRGRARRCSRNAQCVLSGFPADRIADAASLPETLPASADHKGRRPHPPSQPWQPLLQMFPFLLSSGLTFELKRAVYRVRWSVWLDKIIFWSHKKLDPLHQFLRPFSRHVIRNFAVNVRNIPHIISYSLS